MTVFRRFALAVAMIAAIAIGARGQARSAPDWTTQGANAQRSSWIAADPFISLDNLSRFQFLWKLQLDNEPRQLNALTAPVALGNLMTFRGFKSLVLVGGSSNTVYAIDYDFGTLFWKTHLNYTAGVPEFAGSTSCPGGMTTGLSRMTPLVAPSELSYFGFARPPRQARGEVGEPGRGSPRLRPPSPPVRSSSDTAARGAAAPRSGGTPPRPPDFVFAVPADGVLRALNPHTGELAAAPAALLPANATGTGLIWLDGVVYAATTNRCGSALEGISALDWNAPDRPLKSWASDAPIGGFAFAPDGTMYVSTGRGGSTYASSIVALDPKTLTVKNWFTQTGAAFESSPVVFTEAGRSFVVAAAQDGRVFLLDASAPGGADHKTPLAAAAAGGNRRFGAEAPATWRDPQGTRWILAAAGDAIAAYKVGAGAVPSIAPVWVSRALVAPRTPAIVNGVVFALSSGQNRGANAVLYILDPATGKELWTSGTRLTSFATAGLSTGTAQVYVVTHDNTVWAFGIPMAYQ